MGLMYQTALMLGIFFASALFNPCSSQNNILLKTQPWPTPRSCELCIPIQFGKLEMHLPPSEIGKILVLGSGDSILHFFPKKDNSLESVHFLTISPDRLIGTYNRSGFLKELGITTNEQLFDTLGRLPGEKKSLAMMRRVEHIDTAESYFKTSRDSIHVYWIKSSLPGGSQRIYFVINGEEIVYLLAGNVTKELYEAILSNLHIVNVP